MGHLEGLSGPLSNRKWTIYLSQFKSQIIKRATAILDSDNCTNQLRTAPLIDFQLINLPNTISAFSMYKCITYFQLKKSNRESSPMKNFQAK